MSLLLHLCVIIHWSIKHSDQSRLRFQLDLLILHNISHFYPQPISIIYRHVYICLYFISVLFSFSFLVLLWHLSHSPQLSDGITFSLRHCVSLPLNPPTHSFPLRLSSTLSTPFKLFAHLLFSPAPHWYSDLLVCMCVLFTGFILEPSLLCCPPLVCLSAQLHHAILQCCCNNISAH